jgi:prepilin peptidase CpaA
MNEVILYYINMENGMLEAAIIVIFPMCMALGAMTDLISMTIPNRISILLAASFCVIAPLTGMDFITFGWHLVAGVCVFAGCFALFAINAMGGGDVKILAASSLWFGFGAPLVAYLSFVGIFGAILTIIILLLRSKSDLLMLTRIPMPVYVYKSSTGVPYGIAIGIAALMAFPNTAIFTFALGA